MPPRIAESPERPDAAAARQTLAENDRPPGLSIVSIGTDAADGQPA
jgi:hypothetical protein